MQHILLSGTLSKRISGVLDEGGRNSLLRQGKNIANILSGIEKNRKPNINNYIGLPFYLLFIFKNLCSRYSRVRDHPAPPETENLISILMEKIIFLNFSSFGS